MNIYSSGNLTRLILNNDRSIFIPDFLVKIYSDFEPLTKKIIQERVGIDDVFLDIGANVGYFSAIASQLVGEDGKVFSIEANPNIHDLLKLNLPYGNVKVLNTAVGNHSGKIDFFLTKDLVNSGVAPSPFGLSSQKIAVSISTLDQLFEEGCFGDKPINFIKCDVQGDEVAVLEGAARLIAESERLAVMVEWAPTWMKSSGFHDFIVLPKLLSEYGFKEIFAVDDYLKKILPVDEMIQEFAKDTSGRRFCNLFASK